MGLKFLRVHSSNGVKILAFMKNVKYDVQFRMGLKFLRIHSSNGDKILAFMKKSSSGNLFNNSGNILHYAVSWLGFIYLDN